MPDDFKDSGMIALIPDNPQALAVPGGIEPTDLHCTLVFLGDGVTKWSEARTTAMRGLVQDLAGGAPIDTKVFSHSVWNADRAPNPQGEPTKPCLVYQLRDEGNQIAMMARMASRRAGEVLGVDFPEQWSPFNPHIAAVYNQDDPSKLTTDPGPVRFATLRLAIGADVHDFPLTGTAALAYDEGTAMTETEAPAPEIAKDEKTGELALHWPVLVVEGMRTGDGRMIPLGSLGHRGLPLPVAGQVKTDEAHKGAEVFGKITKLERRLGPDVISKETGEPFPEGTAVWEAWGVGDAESMPGKRALEGYLTGNSADLADTTSVEELADDEGRPTVELRGGNIAGTTLVPVPAFADGYVEVNGELREGTPAVKALVAAVEPALAWRSIDPEREAVTAAGDTAETPFRPPLELFQPRQLSGITPLTLEPQPDGTLAVFGHAADFNRPHISFTGQRILARPSPSGYTKGFNTGGMRVMDGDTERMVGVGRLTYGEGHAPTDRGVGASEAKAFYDDPDKAWAWVQASDDQFGVQVNGVVIPGTPDDRVTKALAHPVSGDWRPIDGQLEMVAAHCVNTAGIPVVRQLVASGEVQALVAAGAVAPARDNPTVMAASIVDAVLVQLGEVLPAELKTIMDAIRQAGAEPVTEDPELLAHRDRVLAEIRRDDVLAELGVSSTRDEFDPESLSNEDVAYLVDQFGQDQAPVHVDLSMPDVVARLDVDVTMLDAEQLANWVEKAGGLPPYIKRIAKHLTEKGKDQSQAIATAVNVVKKMCATGDVNFPGKQQVNAGSQAEACAAVASWEKKKKKAQ